MQAGGGSSPFCRTINHVGVNEEDSFIVFWSGMVWKSLNPNQNAVKQKYNTAPDYKGKDD